MDTPQLELPSLPPCLDILLDPQKRYRLRLMPWQHVCGCFTSYSKCHAEMMAVIRSAGEHSGRTLTNELQRRYRDLEEIRAILYDHRHRLLKPTAIPEEHKEAIKFIRDTTRDTSVKDICLPANPSLTDHQYAHQFIAAKNSYRIIQHFWNIGGKERYGMWKKNYHTLLCKYLHDQSQKPRPPTATFNGLTEPIRTVASAQITISCAYCEGESIKDIMKGLAEVTERAIPTSCNEV
ncbi:hypothetical protein BC629DRAFT_1517333 [Irpex lacteus]|nr:hypothetical protein BC629DRAFT_1517333 [Irpex lacteus]